MSAWIKLTNFEFKFGLLFAEICFCCAYGMLSLVYDYLVYLTLAESPVVKPQKSFVIGELVHKWIYPCEHCCEEYLLAARIFRPPGR